MRTCIDNYLKEYLLSIMEYDDEVTVDIINDLLSNVREAFGCDSVFICENFGDKYNLVISYTSVGQGVNEYKGHKIVIEPKDYNEFSDGFGSDNICMFTEGQHYILSYAYKEGNVVKGIVGFRRSGYYEWSEEETEALKKLSRTIHSFVIVSEGRRFIYEHMVSGMERETRYQKELEKDNSKLKLALHSNDGMFRQMIKLQSCGLVAYMLPEWKLYIMNDMAKDIFECENEYEFEQFESPNIRYKSPDITMKLLEEMSEPGNMVSYEFDVEHSDGTIISVDAVSNIIETDEGKKFFVSSLRDITSLKQLEKDLIIERTQYRDVILSDAVFAYTFDVTKGIVEEGHGSPGRNRSWAAMNVTFPIQYDELIMMWDEKKNPHFLNGGTSKQVMRNALLKSFEAGKKNLVFDYEIPREDCSLRKTVLMSSNPNNGHVMACVTLRDVTDSMYMEERRQNELRRTNESLKRQMYIINSLGDIYFSVAYVDIQRNHYSRINAKGYIAEIVDHEGIASATFEEVIKMCVYKKYANQVREFTDLSTLHDRMNKNNVIYTEFEGHEYGWIRASFIKARLDDEDRLKQVLFTMQVIDEEKKKEIFAKNALSKAVEEAEEANRAKSDFLSKMSHDIRTPLNAIIGMTTIASSYADDKNKVIDCMKQITNSGQYLLALINEVLDMSKIESGKIMLSEDKFNIISLVENIVEMTKPLINAKKHEFVLEIDEIENKYVVGDSRRIQQIFMNFLSNAVKYTPDRGHLKLKIKEKYKNKRLDMKECACFVIVFEDDGMGMSEEFQKKIFSPFEREQDSRIDKLQGTGLGMTIAYNLVNMMNGDIRVDSKVDEGSRFTVTIYLKKQELEEGTIGVNSGDSEAVRPLDVMRQVDYKGKRVLLVEDNEINREIAVEIIKETGVSIETASDGQEAVEAFKGKPAYYYDLIFMDIQMPVMNGYEATRAIRSIERTDAKDIPIIAMTANAFAEDVLDARNAGMNEHVAKPIDLNKLMEVIARWMK